jgi:flagellar biosynthetic protein FlhB
VSAAEAARYLGVLCLKIGAPIVLIAWAAAYLSHFAQVGWVFAPKAITPSFRKLNPLSGLKRLMGISGAVKSGMDLTKVTVIAVIAVSTIMQNRDEILVLPYLSSMQALARIGSMMFTLAMRVLIVLMSLGLIDYLYQKWKHARDLKMTKQQVKDEMKQSEGDPEVKRRRIRIQRQIAMQRIAAAVPKADVIVTNPEHISIAIQYDPARMNAPKVIAKGADFIAMRIRQIAMQHGIPIVERKPLARALYKQVAVNQEVPPEFFKAVAEILAYVYRLSGRMVG